MKEAKAMDKKYGWARDMDAAVDHYLKFLKVICNRQQPRWEEARLTLEQLEVEILSAFKKDDQAEKKSQGRAKKRYDAKRLRDGYPPVELQHAAVKKGMRTLVAIKNDAAAQGLTELPFAHRVEALTAVVGIIHYNSFAGRCSEWQVMKRAHVQEQRQQLANHVLCDEYKTSDVYGELAKFIPEGSWRAFEVYNSLPGKNTDLFLDPPSAETKNVSVPQYLHRFGIIHFGDCGLERPPNSNLIRKMYHTVLRRTGGRPSRCPAVRSAVREEQKRPVRVPSTARWRASEASLVTLWGPGGTLAMPSVDAAAELAQHSALADPMT
jgi:hypothetical protein